MNITLKHIAWFVFLFIAYQSITAVVEIDQNWERKIKAQRRNNYQVTTSQEQWRELGDFRKNWFVYFDKESTASSSRHELFKKLKLEQEGLTPSVTKIVSSKSEVLSYSGMPVDLSKTCVVNTQNGIVVKADNINRMLHSLQKLESRKNVVFSDLTLINKTGIPEVIIRDLCVLFRLDGE